MGMAREKTNHALHAYTCCRVGLQQYQHFFLKKKLHGTRVDAANEGIKYLQHLLGKDEVDEGIRPSTLFLTAVS